MKKVKTELGSTALRLTTVVLCLSVSACTTTNLPGLDRILFPNSSAKVGPLIEATEEQKTQEVASDPIASVPKDDIDSNSSTAPISSSNVTVKEDVRKKTEAETVNSNQMPKPETSKTTTDVASAPKQPKTAAPKKNVAQSAPPKKAAPAPMQIANSGAVSGQVILIGEGGQPLAATGTLITLKPKDSKGSKPAGKPKTHVIDMLNKEYQPRYSTINTGDQVVFVNKDNIRHNVFSPSGSNAFDLGTYGAGLKRAVTLEEPGVVKIYCNIHADMATFVAVGDPGLSAKADAQGRYQIKNIPTGTYELTIWNIRGETKKTVEVTANNTVKLIDRVDTTAFAGETHKNKFGGNYSKNAALFEDEFY